jgi:hypothetical protein
VSDKERFARQLQAWKERWDDYDGRRIKPREAYAMFAELTADQLGALINAEITLLSSLARKYRDVPSKPKSQRKAINKLYRRADKIAGRTPIIRGKERKTLFTRSNNPLLTAAQKEFADRFKKGSRRYVRGLIASAVGASATEIPAKLVDAKLAHVRLTRAIKEIK